MLGQPISMLLPQVIGFKLDGELPEGATATDLVLTVTEMLREKGVVAKFVEFFGPGLQQPRRSPTGRRSATCRRSSARPARSSRSTPRRCATSSSPAGRPSRSSWSTPTRASRASSTSRTPRTPTYSDTLELDLGDVVPSIAGPKRPQDRIPLADAKPAFLEAMEEWDPEAGEQLSSPLDEAIAESFPASIPRPRSTTARPASRAAPSRRRRPPSTPGPATRSPSSSRAARAVQLDHGHVVIAAITSCTNTSNPSVMLAAGLVAKKAVERGLRAPALGQDLARARARPWSPSTSRSPGSTSTWTSSSSTSSATAARPASATPARCRRRSRRRSTRRTWSSARCSRATATSRAGSTPTRGPTTWPRRRWSSPTRSPGAWTST